MFGLNVRRIIGIDRIARKTRPFVRVNRNIFIVRSAPLKNISLRKIKRSKKIRFFGFTEISVCVSSSFWGVPFARWKFFFASYDCVGANCLCISERERDRSSQIPDGQSITIHKTHQTEYYNNTRTKCWNSRPTRDTLSHSSYTLIIVFLLILFMYGKSHVLGLDMFCTTRTRNVSVAPTPLTASNRCNIARVLGVGERVYFCKSQFNSTTTCEKKKTFKGSCGTAKI